MNSIELAKQAGFTANDEQEVFLRVYREEIARFATLVRTAALEEAADICDRVNNYDNPMTAGDCADTIRALKGEPE